MGKGFMFMAWVWLIVVIAGGFMEGSVPFATTTLAEAIDDDDTTITVGSTEGFLDTGIIVILDERIAYSSTTNTTFAGSVVNPVVRGANDTDAVAHIVGEEVRTIESAMMNQSAAYRMAVITDASGLLAFVTIPFALLQLLGSYFILPLGFLGTDLEILTYVWGVLTIGMLLALGAALIGGRRV